MAHFPKPFWRTDRKWWMLQVHPGKIITLLADRNAAFREYHAIMVKAAIAPAQSPTAIVTTADDPCVAELLDQFLDWASKNRKPKTFHNLPLDSSSSPQGQQCVAARKKNTVHQMKGMIALHISVSKLAIRPTHYCRNR